MRQLLSRLEDEATGRLKLEALHVAVPPERLEQARGAAATLALGEKFPWAGGTQPMTADLVEQVLNRNWRPTLSVTAADGLPPLVSGGNVLRPFTAVKLSIRLPPGVEPKAALEAVKRTLESDPPYGARVTFEGEKSAAGWNAPELAPWLGAAVERASQGAFGQPYRAMGEGGTIPFMAMLGERFPEAQFLITGVLGPGSNAHGPNEFLHIPTGKKLTAAVASVLADHFTRAR